MFYVKNPFVVRLKLFHLFSEFSESLREMGACLLEKTALNDDEESGKLMKFFYYASLP